MDRAAFLAVLAAWTQRITGSGKQRFSRVARNRFRLAGSCHVLEASETELEKLARL
ncbi:hypothetical protein [Dyadobacter sp. BHUBP1]|uniref:hypothetical protein n=1 Tax=Dyadobacter sp. BHUBP1 TaxID=3424178 RepID=UPI003D328B2E